MIIYNFDAINVNKNVLILKYDRMILFISNKKFGEFKK
jgi:hypothetical protein